MKHKIFAFLALLLTLAAACAGAQQRPSVGCFSPGLVRVSEKMKENPTVSADVTLTVENAFYARNLSVLKKMLEGTTLRVWGDDARGGLTLERGGETLMQADVAQDGRISVDGHPLETRISVPDEAQADWNALAERLRAAQPNTVMIPNGANFERFVQAAQPQPVPEDLRDIPHPIFGFVGALQSCIEYDYLEAAAKARPDWSFVLIGKEKPGVDLTALHAMPNVHFLGLKPNEQLPQYLAHFDACLNLFAKSDLSKDVSPLKFYEYLATGHPIVSTRQPDQILQYAPLIEIADSQEEFIAACKASLTDTAPERTKARIEAGRACSWNSRVAQMCEILQEQGIL